MAEGDEAAKVTVSPDFVLYLYRKQAGLSWADISGVWPQPAWRTSQDLWYMDIEGQVRPILEKRARDKAKHDHRG